MSLKNKFLFHVIVPSLAGIVFFPLTGCSTQEKLEKSNIQHKTDVVTIGLDKSQSKSFADYYAQAAKFFDLEKEGVNLNKQGLYKEAITRFEQALPYADSRPTKAMAYDGLSVSYAGLENISKQIEFLEKEAKATLNENHRADLLKQIEALKASQRKS